MPIPANTINERIDLVDAQGCIEEIWPDERSRPSLRWFKGLQLAGLIPYRKIGRRVFFDPAEVRRALDKRCRKTAG
jgi:hypothetical protein